MFTGDLTGKTVQAGFGTDDLTMCTVGTFASGSTPVTCTGYTQDTTAAAAFHVAVTS